MKPHPTIMYGTAWKEEQTEAFVLRALEIGYRAIDTANQRKHYVEEAVGAACAKSPFFKRDEVFIQTKFTSLNGQDHRVPYDPSAAVKNQVFQSFERSLIHLQVEHIDAYILHGPTTSVGLVDADFEIWNAMETLKEQGRVSYIGVSNVTVDQLALLCKNVRHKPMYVQNRCFARFGWDKKVRALCKEQGIHYQSFSLLTANPEVLYGVSSLADRYSVTEAQIIIRFAQQVGMIPLTGTTSPTHMKQDLFLNFHLSEKECNQIETGYCIGN